LFSYGAIYYTSNLFLKRSAQVATKYVMNLWARLQNYEKKLLASTRLSVCLCLFAYPSAWNISAQAGFSRNLILECIGETCRENSIFIKTGTLHEDLRNCVVISCLIFLRMRNVSEQKLWRRSKRKYNNDFPKIVPFLDNIGKIWYSRTGH
jgi:hypothetical protein